MKSLYLYIENLFDRFASFSMRLFSNSIVFVVAICFVVYWLSTRDWSYHNITDSIRDVILAITFLSFFLIQKWFSRFSQILHLKLNELIVTQENARNHLIKAEEKSPEELKELDKEHHILAEESEASENKPVDDNPEK